MCRWLRGGGGAGGEAEGEYSRQNGQDLPGSEGSLDRQAIQYSYLKAQMRFSGLGQGSGMLWGRKGRRCSRRIRTTHAHWGRHQGTIL